MQKREVMAEGVHMRHPSALLIVGAVAWMPAALGSECFAIRDEEQRLLGLRRER